MMMSDVERLIFGLHTTQQRSESCLLCMFIGAMHPVQRAATEIAPRQIFSQIAALAGAELFQIVGGSHPADVKEILILANA